MDLCNCNSNSSRDDLRLVRGNDFSIIYPINAKYPDGSTVEDFDLHECTDLVVLIKRDSSTAKDIMTYAEGYTITGDKELTVAYDGLKMKLGSYRLDISGKFGGKDWRSYSKDEGFGIVESNEEANIPVGAFIADGVYTVICDFLMTYQTQEQADWEESDTSLPSYIKNKPTIPTTLRELEGDSTHRTVTDSDKAYWDAKSDFSGSYDDLTNKPTIPEEITVDSALSSTSTNPVQNKVIDYALGGKVDKVNGKGLSTNDYTNTEKSKLASLSNYDDTEVRSMINAKYTKPSSGIPASDIANGVIPDVSGFVTKSVNDLVNYYTKTQTYTQSEVNSLIAGISGFEYEVVSTLPTASASTLHKIYLTPSSDPQTQNVKDEYITIESSGTYSWELIGNTTIDTDSFFVYDIDASELNNGYKIIQSSEPYNAIHAAYQAGKVVYVRWTNDDGERPAYIIPLSFNENGWYYFAWSYASPIKTFMYYVVVAPISTEVSYMEGDLYSKPSGGIPKTDLASAVQTSLGKADTSLQPSDVIDSLSSASTTSALSANQGKVLDESKQATIDASHKLSADLVDDASTTNKFVTSSEKSTWNGKADKVLVVNHGTSDTTYTLPPNELHIWGTVASLAITLGTPTDNTIENEYKIQFTSGSTATQFSLPQGVEWGTQDPEQPNPLVVKANAIYQISIINNIGLWTAIANS